MRKSSMKSLKAKAWKAFARYIKAKHCNEAGFCECVTCGKLMWWEDKGVHAGHFVHGRGNAVLFDEEVVRPQCIGCNLFRGGEQAKFAIYLINKENKTQDDIEEMLRRKDILRKYTKIELEEMAEEFNTRADAIQARKGI